jgi:hypothetical protein
MAAKELAKLTHDKRKIKIPSQKKLNFLTTAQPTHTRRPIAKPTGLRNLTLTNFIVDNRPVHNSTLPKVAVSCFVGQFCGYINFSASYESWC